MMQLHMKYIQSYVMRCGYWTYDVRYCFLLLHTGVEVHRQWFNCDSFQCMIIVAGNITKHCDKSIDTNIAHLEIECASIK